MSLELHNEVIGRIIAHLLRSGLSRVDLDSEQVPEIMGGVLTKDIPINLSFLDVLVWMEAEGLIRTGKTYQPLGDSFVVLGVQLTSKGISVSQAPLNKDLKLESTIEKTVTGSKAEDLDSDTYSKMGSFIGSLLGSLATSIG